MVRLEDLIWNDIAPEDGNAPEDENNGIETHAIMSFVCIAMCCGPGVETLPPSGFGCR